MILDKLRGTLKKSCIPKPDRSLFTSPEILWKPILRCPLRQPLDTRVLPTLQTLAGRRRRRGWATRVRWTGSVHDGGRLGRGVRGGARAAHASTTRLYSNSNDTRTRYDDQLSIIIFVILQHVPTTILSEMEVPSQQPADHVLAVARTAGLLRRHARLRRQNVTSTQGKQFT